MNGKNRRGAAEAIKASRQHLLTLVEAWTLAAWHAEFLRGCQTPRVEPAGG